MVEAVGNIYVGNPYSYDSMQNNPRMRSNDRILSLTPMAGKTPKDSIGLLDKRLFTGSNKLHAEMDTQTSLWSLRYEEGNVPQPLRQRFTSFTQLMKFCKDYFARRNVEIKEVID